MNSQRLECLKVFMAVMGAFGILAHLIAGWWHLGEPPYPRQASQAEDELPQTSQKHF